MNYKRIAANLLIDGSNDPKTFNAYKAFKALKGIRGISEERADTLVEFVMTGNHAGALDNLNSHAFGKKAQKELDFATALNALDLGMLWLRDNEAKQAEREAEEAARAEKKAETIRKHKLSASGRHEELIQRIDILETLLFAIGDKLNIDVDSLVSNALSTSEEE